MNELPSINQFLSDVPDSYLGLAVKHGRVSIDTETSGLDWKNNTISVIQLQVSDAPTAIVRVGNTLPANVLSIISNGNIEKIFHHALFDLRFICWTWDVSPKNIACTKIASKLLYPNEPLKQHLTYLLSDALNIFIDKSLSVSNWTDSELSVAQLDYARNDVIHLETLYEVLLIRLRERHLEGLARACFDHVPTRVVLDLNEYPDVYDY